MARGDSGPRAARGAARRALGIPGVARRAEHGVAAEAGVGEFGRVGLAHDDRTGCAQALDIDRIECAHLVAIGPGPERRALAAQRREVLHGHGNAGQRRERFAGLEASVEAPGRIQGFRIISLGERDQVVVVGRDAIERALDQARGRDGAAVQRGHHGAGLVGYVVECGGRGISHGFRARGTD